MNEPYRAVHRYSRNTLGRDLVVGDIHGCFSLLKAELQKLGFDPEFDRLFSVGDLIDRGEESDTVLEAMSRYGIKAVRGNHEQGILDWMALNGDGPSQQFLEDMRTDADHAMSEWAYRDGPTSQLAYNGGEWLVRLYGADDMGWNRAQAIALYFAALPYAIEIETGHGLIGIVHADVPFASWHQLLHALDRPNPDDSTCEQILWDRRRWKSRAVAAHIDGVTAVIAGHTPTHDVAQSGNLINIDTGAVYGNKLTILNLSDIRGVGPRRSQHHGTPRSRYPTVPMKLLVLSDLHNEFEPMPSDPGAVSEADVIVLAGDIHTRDRAIDWTKAFVNDPGKPVIMVAGNHEFYGGHFDQTLTKLREAADGSNIHFLEDDAVVIGGVRFLGCTLWTDFRLPGSEVSAAIAMRDAQSSMNDFRKIRATGTYRRLYPADTVRRHEQSRAWLTNMLQTPFDGRTVVVTHHASSARSIEEQYAGDSLASAYASDLESMMGPNVDLWIHGHMHASFDYGVNGTRVVCNPRGYAPRHLNHEFSSRFLIEV